jgi:alkanesulfonate monooxygenase SsuD/methylene tetrahydromethanopterin reductase-like flavin-dependent oxidoreductase (luciferase family)
MTQTASLTPKTDPDRKDRIRSALALSTAARTLAFGVTIGFGMRWSEEAELVGLAERSGFAHAWMWDSHMLLPECYSRLAVLAAQTQRITLGTCVTHTGPRDPTVTASTFATLQSISGGRMICGIGRGHSPIPLPRARPATLAGLEDAVRIVGDLSAGDEILVEGHPVRLAWALSGRVPVYVGAYGPRALRLAGRVADGVILQIADPAFVTWAMEHVRAGANEVGRDLSGFAVQVAAPGFVSDDLDEAREQVGWFPTMLGDYLRTTLRRYDDASARVGEDEILDRFTVIGSAEVCAGRLRELVAAGATQFNLYAAGSRPATVLERYGREIIPRVGAAEAVG